MPQCPKCGETVEQGAAVCSYCGTALGAGEKSVEPGDQQSGYDDKTPQWRQQDRSQGEPSSRTDGSGRDTSTGDGYQTVGTDSLAQAKTVLFRLPWWAGTTAGGLASLFGIGILWGVMVTNDVPRAGGAATYLFTSLLELSPPSEVARTLVTTWYLPPDTFGSGLLGGQLDAMFGITYLLVPWVFYKSGRVFASKHAQESGNVLDYVGAGVTVIAGTVPVIGTASLVFNGDVINNVFVAGLLVPGSVGAVGGLGVWIFREYRRSPSWGGGFMGGLIGLLVTCGLTAHWASGNVSPGDAMATWLISTGGVFVGVVTGNFNAGTVGLLASAAVSLPVFVFGYFRARRGAVNSTKPLEGARAGATVVAGFSNLFLLALTGYTVLLTAFLTGPSGSFRAIPASFLPAGVTIRAIPKISTLWNYLQAFVVGGVLYPVLVGGAGGAVGGYLQGESVRREKPKQDS